MACYIPLIISLLQNTGLHYLPAGRWRSQSLPRHRKHHRFSVIETAEKSRLPMKKKAAMLREHLPGLLNYERHRITNAISEGFNAKIQVIKSAARGFRCFGNYRTAILFHCGKLNLHPL